MRVYIRVRLRLRCKMKSNRTTFITFGTFLCVACGAFALSFLFYLTGAPLLITEIILVLLAAFGVYLIIRGVKLPKTVPISRREATVRLAVTAVMLACVAMTKLFRFEIPMFGGSGMTVGFSGVFTSIPAMLYGPLFGAAASASSDILGCIISPIGAYNPLFTLTAFVGGFIKGGVWALIKDRKSKSLKWFSAAVGVLLIITGVGFNISFRSDGLFSGFVASAADIPSRGTVDTLEKSPMTELVTSLASYSKDSYTVTAAADGERITVPAYITVDCVKYVPKIGKNAFAYCTGEVYIPATVTSIDKNAFAPGITVHVEEATAEKLKDIDNIEIVIEESIEKTAVAAVYGGGKSQEACGFTLSSTTTYASAVAKYINFLTLGPILAGGSMLLIVGFGLVMLLIRGCGDNGQTAVSGIRVFISIFAAGFVTTTLNTVILRYITYPSWAGRAFYIVWIPRVAEELIVCVIQSYFIALLYDLYRARFASRN